MLRRLIQLYCLLRELRQTHVPTTGTPTTTESGDSVFETGYDMGGTTSAEALNWWADCYPQHRNPKGHNA